MFRNWSIANTILSSLGLSFLLFGLFFIGLSWSDLRDANQLAALPILTLTTLESAVPGEAAIVEGRISERNPLAHRSFVLYTRERFDGYDCDSWDDDDECQERWAEEERITPPLWLDLPDGRVQLANDDYAVTNPLLQEQTTDQLLSNETRRYLGFRIDQPVFAVGQVTITPTGPSLAAERLIGGDRAGYTADQRTGFRIGLSLSLIFVVIGLGLLGLQTWLLLG